MTKRPAPCCTPTAYYDYMHPGQWSPELIIEDACSEKCEREAADKAESDRRYKEEP